MPVHLVASEVPFSLHALQGGAVPAVYPAAMIWVMQLTEPVSVFT
jgi:hypothetical protein